MKNTDTFLLKFIQQGSLKKIRDGLTKELIEYFSEIQIEELMNMQGKTASL